MSYITLKSNKNKSRQIIIKSGVSRILVNPTENRIKDLKIHFISDNGKIHDIMVIHPIDIYSGINEFNVWKYSKFYFTFEYLTNDEKIIYSVI